MNNYKALTIAGSIILVIVILFEFALTLNSKSKNTEAPSAISQASSSPNTNSNNLNYTSTQYGQTISFSYPSEYAVEKGGRPFNMNDEGTSTTFAIQCNNKEKCPENNQLMITVYENRKKMSLDEWMEKSVNRPLVDCRTKNTTIEKVTHNGNPAYHFNYVNDKSSSRGCLDTPSILGSITLYGEETLYIDNESVFDIQSLQTNKNGDEKLQTIVKSLQVQ